jgi:NADH-quinone oxidoreductase subunit C
MTEALQAKQVAKMMDSELSATVIEAGGESLVISGENLLDVVRFLKESPDLEFDYLTSIMGVDRWQYFEVVYLFFSLNRNHRLTLRVRLPDRQNPSLPSVTGLFMGADFQEREIFDLLCISFAGHPNNKRIFLWEGFHGHPLRKDFSRGS